MQINELFILLLTFTDVRDMNMERQAGSSALFKPSGLTPKGHLKLNSKMESHKYCALWCLSKKCSKYTHTSFNKQSDEGDCVIYVKPP